METEAKWIFALAISGQQYVDTADGGVYGVLQRHLLPAGNWVLNASSYGKTKTMRTEFKFIFFRWCSSTKELPYYI